MWRNFAPRGRRTRCFLKDDLLAVCAAAVFTIGAVSGTTSCDDDSEARKFYGHDRTAPALTRNFIADAAALALPAVVNISTRYSVGWQQAKSAGSGFIVRDDGLVVTNAHVVPKSAGEIIVTLNDARRFRGRLVSADRKSDVALVQIDHAQSLPVATIGTSSRLRPGDLVVALGSPLNLSNTVTSGIVSAVARHGSEIGGSTGEYIQTDAAINVGNSGGPLVDLDGKVIGINTMKATRADGISFAIPIDTAWQVVRRLVKHGHVTRPYIGVKMISNPASSEEEDSVVIAEVAPESPADKAGLRAGDRILDFNGVQVRIVADVLAQIGMEDRQEIPVTVLRRAASGHTSTLRFQIKSEPSPHSQ